MVLFEADWFKEVIQQTGPNILNVVTHHIYNLGAGVDEHLVDKILDPSYLSREASTFKSLKAILQRHGPWSSAWVFRSAWHGSHVQHQVLL